MKTPVPDEVYRLEGVVDLGLDTVYPHFAVNDTV